MYTISQLRPESARLISYCLIIICFSLSSCGLPLIFARASADQSNVKQKGPSYTDKDDLDGNFGFNLGIVCAVVLNTPGGRDGGEPQNDDAAHFRLMSGLEYIQKGYNENFTQGNETKTNLDYLKVPLTGLYVQPLSQGNLFGGLGPYLAYGIGGKTKFTSTGGTNSVSSFDKDMGGYKRFDAGLNFLAGYEFNNGFAVSLGYDLGLANIEDNGDDKTYNRTFSINLRYNITDLIMGKKK